MTGLEELQARIAALRWLHDLPIWREPLTQEHLSALADVLQSSADIVERDYVPDTIEVVPAPEPEPETDTIDPEPEPAAEEPAEAEPATEEQPHALAEILAEPARRVLVEAAPIAPPKPRAAVPTPQAVIRAWALKEGIAVNTRGHVSTEALERINARRAEQRLPPFGAKPSEVEDA